jgi:hypothetical protein
MNLDIRLPIGMLFTTLGVLLVGYGLMGDPSVYQKSLGHNVNLEWGAVVLVFGLVFLVLGRKGSSGVREAAVTVEGQATEAREHATGLEVEDVGDRPS